MGVALPAGTMRSAFLAVLVLTSLSGCVAEVGDEVSNVVVVDVANHARVEEDRLVFPAHLVSADVRAKIDAYDGDRWFWQDHEDTEVEQVLFVSDRANFVTAPDGSIDASADNPYGFIRRALSYEIKGNDILIDTEMASLADVLSETALHGQVGIASDYPKPQHDQTIFIDKSGLELWRNGAEYVRFPSLWVNVDPQVDLDLSVGVMKVKSAHLTVTVGVESELVVDANVSQLPEQALYRTVYDKPYKLDPIGLIPVSARIRIDVGCEKTGGPVSIEGGLRSHISLRGDVDYVRESGTSFDGHGSFEPELRGKRFEAHGGGNAKLRCVAQPYVTVMMYDLPTGSLAAHADFDLAISGPTLVATTKANAKLTGILATFGADLANAEGTLLDVQKTLWNGQAPASP
jgi:hypothetical protein